MNKIIIQIKKHKNISISVVVAILLMGIGILAFIFLNKKDPVKECLKLTDQVKKLHCWNDAVNAELATGKIDQTMDLIAEFYNTDPSFAANCHDFMHSVGKAAYELFAQGKPFNVGPKTSYCAYGFYHGFMENLVAQKGDPSLARQFCAQIDAELSKTAPGAKLACYHGIGHGWTNVHDPRVYGNEDAMVDPALALCGKVTQDPNELKICATGVFDSISISYYNQEYGLKMNKADPYELCKRQELKFQEPCYMDISPAVLWLGNYKLDQTLTYLKTVPQAFKNLVTSTIAEDSVRFIINNKLNINDQINTCRNLLGDGHILCIQGLASGYDQFGTPGSEEYSALQFCTLDYLTSTEKDACFAKIISNAKISISQDRVNKLCASIPVEFKKYCAN